MQDIQAERVVELDWNQDQGFEIEVIDESK
jgi:hypothetical protein